MICGTSNRELAFILPVYNVERYLTECLESINKQTTKTYTVLAVDDGSTDNSGIILDEYAKKHQWLKVFHKTNGGVSSARNFALDKIDEHYKYISFIDPDDILDSSYVETMVSAIEANDTDIVYCRLKVFDKSGYLDAHLEDYEPSLVTDLWHACFAEKKKYGFFWGTGTKVYKRSIIGNTRYDITLKVAEDADFLFQLINKGATCFCIPDFLYFYRARKSSVCKNVHHQLIFHDDSALAFRRVDVSKIAGETKVGFYNFLYSFEYYGILFSLRQNLGEADFLRRVTEINNLPSPAHLGLQRYNSKLRRLKLGYHLLKLHTHISDTIKKFRFTSKKKSMLYD